MIGKLKGIVDEISLDHLLIDVVGVGYLVYCSARTLRSLSQGHAAEIYIETHVREDQITLYGFKDKVEKRAFLKLITVKGVGPKVAMAILGGIEPQKLFLAIASADTAMFSSISGIGPKLATRIVTELKDKEFILSSDVKLSPSGDENVEAGDEMLKNAVQALQNLGVSRSEAYAKVSKIIMEKKDLNLSDLIRESLKEISK